MRKILLPFAMGVLALEFLSAIGTAKVVLPRPFPKSPPSLKTVAVPVPEQISEFVKDRAAAVALGKAFFWDTQAASDGRVACASCHFKAGADSRQVNQLNPGANGTFDMGGQNHTFTASEFPFHQLVDPDDRASARVRSRDDVSGSQGVHSSEFQDIVPGSASDARLSGVLDPLGFHVSGLNTRRVTGRNVPTMVNAVFNVRSFWDGRANRRFNGRSPFGDADPDARVLRVNELGEPEPVRISLDHASLASQAVGPPLSDVEMSAAGRTLTKFGKKMLTLTPLANQAVHSQDGVLGVLAVRGGTGLNTTYANMIRAAFHERWWNSNSVVDASLAVIPGVSVPSDGTSLPTDQFSVMEANFSMFWGLAIMAYEATLVSDDAPYDRFAEGNIEALTPQQRMGLRMFLSSSTGKCIECHSGAEFTDASSSARLAPPVPGGETGGVIDHMPMADGHLAVYDGGFHNIGVRSTQEDIGLGANDPFGNPLSVSRLEQLNPGSVENNNAGPIGPDELARNDGAFKTPSLRNVELTGPYFHNGSIATLSDVVQFYTRGGNFHDENLADLDGSIHRARGLIGHPMRQFAIAAFLRSLTDERVRWERAPFDHPEIVVQSGAKGGELAVLQDLTNLGQAADELFTIPATGAGGTAAPMKQFLDLPVFAASSIAAPNPVLSNLAMFASDTIIVRRAREAEGDLWSNGAMRITGKGGAILRGDMVAGGDIMVNGGPTVIDGNLMAKGGVKLSATIAVENGEVGANVEHFAPLVMPSLPAVSAGTGKVTVQAATTVTLLPGAYGDLQVQRGGTLVLQAGTYVFRSLSMSLAARLQYDLGGVPDTLLGAPDELSLAPTEKTIVHVLGNVGLSSGAAITSGAANRSNRLRLFVHGSAKPIVFEMGSLFHGSLIAPTSSVSFGQGSSFAGAIYARRIELAEDVAFRSHPHPAEERLPTVPVAALQGDIATPEAASGPGLEFVLSQNQPNPFRPSTLIRFTLPQERDVKLDIFDVSGRIVKTLAKGALGPGLHTLAWNGTGRNGMRLSSGVYLYRLVAGADRAERKMILVN